MDDKMTVVGWLVGWLVLFCCLTAAKALHNPTERYLTSFAEAAAKIFSHDSHNRYSKTTFTSISIWKVV
jgi:hypothetical protein